MLKVAVVWLIGSSSVMLNWGGAPTPPNQPYRIYRANKACAQLQQTDFTLIGETSNTVYIDNTISDKNKYYCYRVRTETEYGTAQLIPGRHILYHPPHYLKGEIK